MTQELTDLRNSILQGNYADALAIVDELEGMSKKAILRQIKSFIKILLIHLIKNHIEQRLTNSWVASIRNSIREIQEVNIKENKTSYYVNQDEWVNLIEEEVIEDAIADASLEVMNGKYSQFQLADVINRTEIIENALKFLTLTYAYSAKQLPAIVADTLTQLPGGEDWKAGRW
jgi:Cys-tRNA synthase (O-phospho-L-seryl-tRNA:Cys-tRNA synthase)